MLSSTNILLLLFLLDNCYVAAGYFIHPRQMLSGRIPNPSITSTSRYSTTPASMSVDLYYWPERDADRSCLSIIGNSSKPLDYGATKRTTLASDNHVNTVTYWGCTTKNSTTLATDVCVNWNDGIATITTAEIVTIGSLLVKVSSFNPWSSLPCTQEDAASRISSVVETLETGENIHRRDQSLINPSSIAQNRDFPASVVIENTTL